LEGVKGEANRQNQFEGPDGILPMKPFGYFCNARVEKIEIFKNKQQKARGNDADNKKKFLSLSLTSFNQNGGRIINDNGKEQNENINWNGRHVKDTASNQKQKPPIFMWKEEVGDGNDREKK